MTIRLTRKFLLETSRNTTINIQWDNAVKRERNKIRKSLSTIKDVGAYATLLAYLKWMSSGNTLGHNDGNASMKRVDVKLMDASRRIYEIKTPPFRTYYRLATIQTPNKNPFKVCYIVLFLRKDSEKARDFDKDGANATWIAWRDSMKALGKKVETTNTSNNSKQRTVNDIIRNDPYFFEKHLNNCYNILCQTHDGDKITEYFRKVLDGAIEE